MRRLLNPELALVLIFLGIVASVPVVQFGIEAGRGDQPLALDVFKQKPTARNLRAYEHGLEDASWLAAKLRPCVQYAQFAWLRDGGAKSLIGRDGWLFYKPGVEYITERPGSRQARGTVNQAVAAIVDLKTQLAARGIQLLVMPAPNKESIYPEKLTRRAAGRGTVTSPETRELLQRLKAADVEVIDLFDTFAAAKAAATPSSPALYLAQDTHWSPAGLEIAARAVAQRLLEKGWVDKGNYAYAVVPAPIPRLGDVLRMLQVPQLEAQTQPELVPCQRVTQSNSTQPYHDSEDSGILVMGDSFLRIYETDEPGSAGFIAHLARELRQPVTSLVNDGGASTLVRQELSRRPALLANKKVVLWEFVERDIRLGEEGWQQIPLGTLASGSAPNPR